MDLIKINITSAFEAYKDVIFNVSIDLNFWQSFLNTSIESFQKDEKVARALYEAMFCVYDINIVSNVGYSKVHNSTRTIKTTDLQNDRIHFFNWILNLAILKCYNALEILLIQGIWLNFYPELNNPIKSKQATICIQKKIKIDLEASGLIMDKTNNKHLIKFLELKCSSLTVFFHSPVRINSKTTWIDFFEMFSILRNVTAHQGIIVSSDTHNSLKQKAKDIFEGHFEVIKTINNQKHLFPKEDQFSNFLVYINDFAANTIKFMSNEKDLKFLNLY